MMTTKLIAARAAFVVLGAALAGCVAVPVEPGPGYYGAPPAVVVQPYVYGGYYSYGYRGRPYWHHRDWR